jgi:flagellar motor switch protein FliM
MLKRQLTQQEIDEYFQTSARGDASAEPAVPFDFRRSDRIPKSQLSAIHFLHEAFVRTLTSSLSVYLRSYVSGNLISVEQLPYADFADSLPSPTCIVYLSMHPYEGHTLVEVNQTLIAPILDFVLGGNGKIKTEINREITDIEENMLAGFFRIIGHDLMEAWKPIATIDFTFDALETKPQLSKRIARNEAVVAIAMELRIGDNTGMVNLAIPSITLKMLRHRFDQQYTVRKQGSLETEMAIRRRVAEGLKLDVECALLGASIRLGDLLSLRAGDVMDLRVVCDGMASVLVNGVPRFNGEVSASDLKQTVRIRRSVP